MHAPFTIDGRRSLRRSSAASVAVAGMVRASNEGEAMEMAAHRPDLVAPRRVSHAPLRRQPLCTSTKTTGTTAKTTVDWSLATAPGWRAIVCGVLERVVWLAVGEAGHARTGRAEAVWVARERGGARAWACRTFRHFRVSSRSFRK